MVVTGGPSQPSTHVRMEIRQNGLTWHVVGNEVVILDLERSTYLKLNGTARMLWECLTNSSTADELTSALVARFGIAEEVAGGDVATFLTDLRERDLLVG